LTFPLYGEDPIEIGIDSQDSRRQDNKIKFDRELNIEEQVEIQKDRAKGIINEKKTADLVDYRYPMGILQLVLLHPADRHLPDRCIQHITDDPAGDMSAVLCR
jgi:hypothetical protein